MTKKILRVKLSDAVINELQKMIASKLKPGDRLPTENELAKIYGVGRSSIREALKVLSALGLVERRNEGTFVSSMPNDYLTEPLSLLVSMDFANLSDVVEMRELLEIEIVRLATIRATNEDISIFENLVWEMEKPGLSTDAFVKADIHFHSALAKATGNIVLCQTLNAIRSVLVRFHEQKCGDSSVQESAIVLHKNMLQAIRNRNPKEAQIIMEEHLKVARVFHGIPLNEEAI